MAAVTIVLATYNRPKSLRYTINSVLAQSFEDWVLLVIGDNCSEETDAVLASYDDSRIVYHNLEERCGEQSGPNSIGFFLARSEYVAFVNHDDIWLSDHLAQALQVMEKNKVEFYCSGAALTAYAKDAKLGVKRPVIWEVSPPNRKFKDAYHKSTVLFEPISAWVMKRSLLEKVGVWRPAAQLFRTPLVDWVLRAWRKGVSHHFSNTVTVIYCNAEKRGMVDEGVEKGLYFNGESEGQYWMERFRGLPVEKVRQSIAKEEKLASHSRSWTFFTKPYAGRDFSWVFDGLLTPEIAPIFRKSGWDGYDKACKILGIQRGETLAGMLSKRTGEVLKRYASWQSLAEKAKRDIEANERWLKANRDA